MVFWSAFLATFIGAEPPPRVAPDVVMPASGVTVSGLPGEFRWEVEGTVVVSERGQLAIDRLSAWSDAERRELTVEITKTKCPELTPQETSPWPKLGYQALRVPVPERLAVRSCKAPDLLIELRFPAGTSKDEVLLLEVADEFEPVVAALHEAYSNRRVDLARALGNRDRLAFEQDEDAPDELLASLSLPMSIRVGTSSKTRGNLVVDRAADRLPWTLRTIGSHDFLELVAPTAAGVSFQLIPFDPKASCEQALDYAVAGQPKAPANAFVNRLPPGWEASRPVGAENAAFCIHSTKNGGLVAIGGGRVPRDSWLPIAMPILGRIGEALQRR